MSRRKNAARDAARVEHVRAVLRHGTRFIAPAREVVDAAQWLAGLGIIELRGGVAVGCANPLDADFPPVVRDCDGLIELRDGADEGGGDYRCPHCERVVFPEADDKERCEILSVRLQQERIEAFLIERCGDWASGRSFVGGVLTLPLSGINGFICIVDYCADERWYRRSTAAGQPCVYVTVDPDKASQILKEDAIARAELVDILLGTKDLRALLAERAGRGPALLANVDVPVYGLGARPIGPEPRKQAAPRCVFHLCLSREGVLVDGLLAVRIQRRATAMAVMQVLMNTYAEAVVAGCTVEPMTADSLADAVEQFIGTVEDADNIARNIRRMRKSIVDTVRQHTGKPIGEHDIIETVSRSGADEDAEGYRLNPRSVAISPFQR